jgi:hypothetical protein
LTKVLKIDLFRGLKLKLFIIFLSFSFCFGDLKKNASLEGKLLEARKKAQEQVKIAKELYTSAKNEIEQKKYADAEAKLQKIIKYLNVHSASWPIILDSSILKNYINLEQAKDAILSGDDHRAITHLNNYLVGLKTDLVIQGDPSRYGVPGLVKSRGSDALFSLLSEAQVILEGLRAKQIKMSENIDELELKISDFNLSKNKNGLVQKNIPRWYQKANWERVNKGMLEVEILSILGTPTKKKRLVFTSQKSIYYEVQFPDQGIISGHVKFLNSRATDIVPPDFGSFPY